MKLFEREKFKDMNPEELNSTIQKLRDDLKAKDDEYAAAREAYRAFTDPLKEAIKVTGGHHDKAVMALLFFYILEFLFLPLLLPMLRYYRGWVHVLCFVKNAKTDCIYKYNML